MMGVTKLPLWADGHLTDIPIDSVDSGVVIPSEVSGSLSSLQNSMDSTFGQPTLGMCTLKLSPPRMGVSLLVLNLGNVKGMSLLFTRHYMGYAALEPAGMTVFQIAYMQKDSYHARLSLIFGYAPRMASMNTLPCMLMTWQ